MDSDNNMLCNYCETPCRKQHCKIVCPNCGIVRDCSDPFY